MPSTYRTPGVYVEEVSKFPPSVATVETAIPAFIGYTEKAEDRGENLDNIPTRISSLLDYDTLFGGAPPIIVNNVVLDADNNVTEASLSSSWLLYDSLRIFFNNGGGPCYIISVGRYSDTIDKAHFEEGLKKLVKKDEPTLILFPDAVLLKSDDLYDLQKLALAQCNKLKDRFVIMDLLMEREDATNFDHTDAIQDFRDKIGLSYLSYGAAYTPYLKTNFSKRIIYRQLAGNLEKFGTSINLNSLTSEEAILKAIRRLEAAISDYDKYYLNTSPTSIFNQFLANEGVNSLEEGYFSYLNTFKTAAFSGNETNTRSAFKDLFKYIYSILEDLVDEPTNYPSSLLANSSDTDFQYAGVVVRFVVDEIKELVDKTLWELMVRLNSYNKNINGLVGGTSASSLWAAYTWTGPLWIKNSEDAFDDTTPVIPDPPVGPSGVYETSLGNIENMQKAEPYITAVFQNINNIIQSIINYARLVEKTYDEGLKELFPTYRMIVNKVRNSVTDLPPGGAVAGIYARVDNDRGVWKAPANVNLNSVVSLTETIDETDQEELNVDVVAGKSINAIRAFTGKGIFVWGARTLAGNDNEWRYVPVRRFFNMAEESIKKATAQFVFEPNDAKTWVKVRAMIENFLIIQWRAGALAGAKPDQAFYVKVGLNETMTAVDIQEGRMIVEIGMAVVRPAEFIVLSFSHMMQES